MKHDCILVTLSSSRVVQEPAGQLGELGDGTGGLQVDHFEEGASDPRGQGCEVDPKQVYTTTVVLIPETAGNTCNQWC